MKYLQPSFTIYPSVRPKRFAKFGRVKVIDPKHKFIDLGGMCRFCALSKEGHQAKHGRKPFIGCIDGQPFPGVKYWDEVGK